MATYRSLTIREPNLDLQLQTHDLHSAFDSLPPKGAVIKVRAAGVCHSDIHVWKGGFNIGKEELFRFADRPGYGYPIVPGHEISGTVAVLGAQAMSESIDDSGENHLKIGDRVAVYPWVGCDVCPVCTGGDPHLCSGATRQLGFNVDGGYSEYVQLPHHQYAVKIPHEISDETAAMLPCSAVTAFSAIEMCTQVVERVKRWNVVLFVAVIGLGGLGQWALKLLPHCIRGCSVVGIDISSQKLEFVQQENLVNDTFLFQPSVPTSQQRASFLAKFNGNKPHVILDFVSTSETFPFGLSVLHKGGCIVPIGLHGGSGEIKLPFVAINTHTIAGSHVGSPSQLKQLISIVKKHSIAPPPVVTYPLEEGGKALEDLEKGSILGRAILKMDTV